jgi:hypothetical protein
MTSASAGQRFANVLVMIVHFTMGHAVDRSKGERWRGWQDVAAKALFEILIVAVGVMLALAVDEWRERSEQKELADQARAALRAEILSNREVVVARLRRTAELYLQTAAHPDQARKYVFERRNLSLLINDSAWTMAVETGAIRWLAPVERRNFANVYAGQQRARDVVLQEMIRWTELAGLPERPETAEMKADRGRAILIWQAFAHRTQFALCVNAGRYERTLGADVPEDALLKFCAQRRPDDDPVAIYREWRKLGWTSSTAPRSLMRAPVEQ